MRNRKRTAHLMHLTEAFAALCKAKKMWGLYIGINPPSDPNKFLEIYKAAPYLDPKKEKRFGVFGENPGQALADEHGFLLFRSRKQMERFYDLTVGDDGPTKRNSYNGEANVYALTCTPDGILQNENT